LSFSDTDLARLLQRNAVRTVGLIAGFGMVLPFAAGLGLVAALGTKEFIGPAGNQAALILVFGLAVAVTSIPVISRIMLASTAYATGIVNESFFVSLVMLSVIISLLAGSWLERIAVKLGARRASKSRPASSSPANSAPPDNSRRNDVIVHRRPLRGIYSERYANRLRVQAFWACASGRCRSHGQQPQRVLA